jgi:hypothetical protein
MIVTLLLVALVTVLVMMEKNGFSRYYEIRCDAMQAARADKCAPSGNVVEVLRDPLQKRVIIDKSNAQGKRVDFAQGVDCQIPDNQHFRCTKKILASLEDVVTGNRKGPEAMEWHMAAGKLLNQSEPPTRAFYVDGFELERRRLLFGWNP